MNIGSLLSGQNGKDTSNKDLGRLSQQHTSALVDNSILLNSRNNSSNFKYQHQQQQQHSSNNIQYIQSSPETPRSPNSNSSTPLLKVVPSSQYPPQQQYIMQQQQQTLPQYPYKKSSSLDLTDSPPFVLSSSPTNSFISSGPPSPNSHHIYPQPQPIGKNKQISSHNLYSQHSLSQQQQTQYNSNSPKLNYDQQQHHHHHYQQQHQYHHHQQNQQNVQSIPPLHLQSISNIKSPNRSPSYSGKGVEESSSSSSSPTASPEISPKSSFALSRGSADNVYSHPNFNYFNYSKQSALDKEKEKKRRTRLKKEQTRVLKEFFDKEEYPTKEDKEYLSKMLNMTYNTVTTWFSNKRQDKKRKVNEPTSSAGKRIPVGDDSGPEDDDDQPQQSYTNGNGVYRSDLTPMMGSVGLGNSSNGTKKYAQHHHPYGNSPRSTSSSPRMSSSRDGNNSAGGAVAGGYRNSQNQMPPFTLSKQHRIKTHNEDEEYEYNEELNQSVEILTNHKIQFNSHHASNQNYTIHRRNSDSDRSDSERHNKHKNNNNNNHHHHSSDRVSLSDDDVSFSDEEEDSDYNKDYQQSNNNTSNSIPVNGEEFLQHELQKLSKKFI